MPVERRARPGSAIGVRRRQLLADLMNRRSAAPPDALSADSARCAALCAPERAPAWRDGIKVAASHSAFRRSRHPLLDWPSVSWDPCSHAAKPAALPATPHMRGSTAANALAPGPRRTVARQKSSRSNGTAGAGSRLPAAQRHLLPSARDAASPPTPGGKHAAAEHTPVCEQLLQPRWRAEAARREGSASDQAAETAPSPPWADMPSSLIEQSGLTCSWVAAPGSNSLPSSPALKWRCARSDHTRTLFASSSLARARREAARAAEARLEAAARQVTMAQSRSAEPSTPAAGRRHLGAEEIVGAAADAEAALAAAEIRAAVAKHCSERAPWRGETAQANPGAASERVLLPRSAAQRAAAVIASCAPSMTHPTAASANPTLQLQPTSAQLCSGSRRGRLQLSKSQQGVVAAFPVVPRRPMLVS